MRFSLDRATVRKRLMDAEIEPASEAAKEKLYELTEDLEAALLAQTRPIDAAKLRKETAEAQIKEIKLREMTGEMASVAEFTQIVQALFGAMHKRACVQLPKKLAKKLSKSKDEAEISRLLEKEYGALFLELRANYKKFLDKKLTG